MNNSAGPSSPPRIPLRYLGLLGDADSHVPVGLGGPLCCLAVPETVITLQVSNLGTETHAGQRPNQHPSPPAAALQLLNYGAVGRVFYLRWKPETRGREDEPVLMKPLGRLLSSVADRSCSSMEPKSRPSLLHRGARDGVHVRRSTIRLGLIDRSFIDSPRTLILTGQYVQSCGQRAALFCDLFL